MDNIEITHECDGDKVDSLRSSSFEIGGFAIKSEMWKSGRTRLK